MLHARGGRRVRAHRDPQPVLVAAGPGPAARCRRESSRCGDHAVHGHGRRAGRRRPGRPARRHRGQLLRPSRRSSASSSSWASSPASGVVIGFMLIIIPRPDPAHDLVACAAPVVVLERPPGLSALGRSRELVRRQRLAGVRGDRRARRSTSSSSSPSRLEDDRRFSWDGGGRSSSMVIVGDPGRAALGPGGVGGALLRSGACSRSRGRRRRWASSAAASAVWSAVD